MEGGIILPTKLRDYREKLMFQWKTALSRARVGKILYIEQIQQPPAFISLEWILHFQRVEKN